MAECTTKSLGFAGLGRKRIEADFAGGQLTSDAGSLLLREVDKRIGLFDAIDSCIPDPRDPRYVQHLTGLRNSREIARFSGNLRQIPVPRHLTKHCNKPMKNAS